LVKDQTDPTENAIYDYNAGGAWTLAADSTDGAKLPPGATVYVQAGATNKGSSWVLTTPGPITIGSSSLRFVKQQPEVDVKVVGAIGDGSTSDTTSLQVAHAAAKSVVYSAGSYKVDNDVTLGADETTVHRILGASELAVSSGKTVTLRGTIQAPKQQIFSGSGTVLLPDMPHAHAEWFGADPTAAFDNAAPIAKAIAAITSGDVHLGPGVYEVNTDNTILLPPGKSLRGAGKLATTLQLLCTSDVGIQITTDVAGQPTGQEIADLTITAPSATAPAVRLVGGVSEFLVSFKLRDVWFYQCAHGAIDVSDVILDCSWEDCQFTQCCQATSVPVVTIAGGGTTHRFSRCYWSNNRNASDGLALHVTGGDGVWLDNCIIESSGKAVQTVNADLFVAGCHFENCYAPTFKVDGGFSMSQSWIAAVDALGTQTVLDGTDVESVSIDGCDFWDFGATDTLISAAAPPRLFIGANRTHSCNAAFVSQLHSAITSPAMILKDPTFGEYLRTAYLNAGGTNLAYLSTTTADQLHITSSGRVQVEPTSNFVVYVDSGGGTIGLESTLISSRKWVQLFYPGFLTSTQVPSGDGALFLGAATTMPSGTSPPVSGATIATSGADGSIHAVTPAQVASGPGVDYTIAPVSHCGQSMGKPSRPLYVGTYKTTTNTAAQHAFEFTLPTNTHAPITVTVTAWNAAHDSASWKLTCRAKNVGGTYSILGLAGNGTDANADSGLSTAQATLAVDNSAHVLFVSIQGVLTTDVYWSMTVDVAAVTE
jgi:hypothetical protein